MTVQHAPFLLVDAVELKFNMKLSSDCLSLLVGEAS